MKKLFLLAVSLFAISYVSAQTSGFEKRVLDGTMILANRTLSEQGKAFVKKYLGQSFYEDVQALYELEKKGKATHSTDIHYLYLDKDFKPIKTNPENLISKIEESIAIVRDRNNKSRTEVANALRTIINLMSDMHDIGHIRLESVPHSQQEFKVYWCKGDIPKYKKSKASIKWTRFWASYASSHSGTTSLFWADEYAWAHGDKAKEYAAGSLYDWAADMGKIANEMYKWATPDCVLSRLHRNDMADVHFEMMAKLAYRLGAMLEELAK